MTDRKSKTKDFTWVPGHGPDVESVLRLTKQFQMPKQPMGEAWFMGPKRKMFAELMAITPDHWNPDLLCRPLDELASGPGCFGYRPGWTAWAHFLLAHLTTRIDGSMWTSAYEQLISAFVAHYPDENMTGPYEEFRSDVLSTVGKIPMATMNWNHGELRGSGLISSIEETPHGPFISCGGAFSAALFLNLKYLNEDKVAGWLSSVFAIRDPIWRVKLALWIEASSQILIGSGHQPCALEFEPSDGSGWEASWCLKGSSPSKDVDASQIEVPFINENRQQVFHDVLKAHLSVSALDALIAYLATLELQYPGINYICDRLSRSASAITRDYDLA
jgi:hypothetical protein